MNENTSDPFPTPIVAQRLDCNSQRDEKHVSGLECVLKDVKDIKSTNCVRSLCYLFLSLYVNSVVGPLLTDVGDVFGDGKVENGQRNKR